MAISRRVLLLVIGVTGLTMSSCRSVPRLSPAPPMRPSRISIDSTAVIIHIVNYSAQEILVSLETGEARLPVGKVAGLQEALFVLPGDKITDLGDFAVEVTQNGLAVGRTKPVRRVPGKLARVYLILGPRPGGATSPADRLVRS